MAEVLLLAEVAGIDMMVLKMCNGRVVGVVIRE